MSRFLSRTQKLLSNAKTQSIIREINEFIADDEAHQRVDSDNSDDDKDFDVKEFEATMNSKRSGVRKSLVNLKRRKLKYEDQNVPSGSRKHVQQHDDKSEILKESFLENTCAPLKIICKKSAPFKEAFLSAKAQATSSSANQTVSSVSALAVDQTKESVVCPPAASANQPSALPEKATEGSTASLSIRAASQLQTANLSSEEEPEPLLEKATEGSNASLSIRAASQLHTATLSSEEEPVDKTQTGSPLPALTGKGAEEVTAVNQATKSAISPPDLATLSQCISSSFKELIAGRSVSSVCESAVDQSKDSAVSSPAVSANPTQPISFSLKELLAAPSVSSVPEFAVDQAKKSSVSPLAIAANLSQATFSSLKEPSLCQISSVSALPENATEGRNTSPPIRAASQLQTTTLSPEEESADKTQTGSPLPALTGKGAEEVTAVNQATKSVVSSSASQPQATSFSPEGLSGVETGSSLRTPTVKTMETPSNTTSSSILATSTPLAGPVAASVFRQIGLSPKNSSTDGFNVLNGEWVKDLLQKSPDGRSVILWFQEHGTLLSRKRDMMVKIIIDNEVNDDASKLISPERFSAIADAICLHFTSEIPQTYYIPRQKTRQKKIIRAKGKLYDKWINTRRHFRRERIIIGRQNLQPSDLSDNSESEEDPETETAELTWTKSKSGPFTEAVENFKVTCPARLRNFKKSNKTILQFLQQYPAYLADDGESLIEKDFALTFPGKENKLLRNWSRVTEKIINYATKLIPIRPDFADQLGKIDLTIPDQRVRETNALLILPLLFRSVSVKKGWKLTKTEAKDAFLLFAEDTHQAVHKLNLRLQNLVAHKWQENPTAVAVGYDDCLVSIGKVVFTASSPLSAVDLCCKLLFLLDVELPGDTVLSLLFLKCFIYEIDVESSLQYQGLLTLKNDLSL